jgi:hypothetical protein
MSYIAVADVREGIHDCVPQCRGYALNEAI